jgi:hypothetical protein
MSRPSFAAAAPADRPPGDVAFRGREADRAERRGRCSRAPIAGSRGGGRLILTPPRLDAPQRSVGDGEDVDDVKCGEHARRPAVAEDEQV